MALGTRSFVEQDGITHQSEWIAPGGLVATREALRGAAAAHGGTVLADEQGSIDLRFGSRLAARLGGVALPWSRKRLPVRVRVELVELPSDGVRLVATAGEDPGWNALSFPNRVAPYRAAMDEAVRRLRQATETARG